MRAERLAEGVDLYEGSALDVLPTLAGLYTVVTDPPYGLGFPYRSYEDSRDNLRSLIAGTFPEMQRVANRMFITPGQSQVGLYPPADWLLAVTWNTTGTFGKYGYSQWMPVLAYGKDLDGFGNVNGMLKSDLLTISGGGGVGFRRDGEKKDHPCPKPLNLMRLMVRRLTNPGETIIDPFAGSGTTGVAAMLERRPVILIEKDPHYCDVIRRRVQEADCRSPGTLFAETP